MPTWEELAQALQALGVTSGARGFTIDLPDPQDPDRRELVPALTEALSVGWGTQALDTETTAALLALPPSEKARLAHAAITWCVDADPSHRWALIRIGARLMRSALPFDAGQLIGILDAWRAAERWTRQELPTASILGAVERLLGDDPPRGELRTRLVEVAKHLRDEDDAASRKLADRADRLLARGAGVVALRQSTFAGDPWGPGAEAWLLSLPADRCHAWSLLLDCAATTGEAARPSAKWLREAAPAVAAVGASELVDRLVVWLPELPMGPASGHGFMHAVPPGLDPRNADRLKGLIFAASALPDPRLPGLLGDFAVRAFKKIPDVGPGNAKLGNAAVVALSLLPDRVGISALSRLLGRVRYPSARKQIDKTLQRAALAAGLSRDDLEELAVPDFGLDGSGDLSGLPAAQRREVADAIAGQIGRIERLLTRRRDWSVDPWRARYGDHPLLAPVARALIWQVPGGSALWTGTAWIGPDGAPVAVARDARIALWHPMDADPDTVLAWRDQLEARGIGQPFKQAWREVYVLTPAERETGTYSNRFAGHLLRQHAFHALCQQRGWTYGMMGRWDAHNTPTRPLPDGGNAMLWVEAVEDRVTTAQVYALIATDQVRFADAQARPVPLHRVDPRVFSEVMRDVDLFVSVCSVGADEGWADQGDERIHGYWEQWSFGELSEVASTRRAALERLVPRLKIADRCRFDGRWLEVRGSLRSYRIHLGSGNVQVLPEQRYLCIVPVRSDAAGVRLPFEGDATLSIIVSKAVLLANDDQIVDPTILAQLRQGR